MVSKEFSFGFAVGYYFSHVFHTTSFAKENPLPALLISCAISGLLVTNQVANCLHRLGGDTLRSLSVGFSAGSSVGCFFVKKVLQNPDHNGRLTEFSKQAR